MLGSGLMLGVWHLYMVWREESLCGCVCVCVSRVCMAWVLVRDIGLYIGISGCHTGIRA